MKKISKQYYFRTLRLLSVLAVACCCFFSSRIATAEAPPAKDQSKKNAPSLRLQEIASGFTHPMQLVQEPGNKGLMYVVEQEGKVIALDLEAKGPGRTLLDISDSTILGTESGLLGFAFHPHYPEVMKGYAHYIGKSREQENRISEFSISQAGVSASGNDERKLIRLSQASTSNFGGHLMFGPDEYLYIGIGDGGGFNDPDNRGQNTMDQFGNILRINVEEQTATQQPYLAPLDNPYVAQGRGHRDLWAPGFRNPRTLSFDSLNHDLWVGDAGEGVEQELDLVDRGGNYGWSVFDGDSCLRMRFECMNQKYLPPVISYEKKDGSGIVAGFAYHGAALADDYEGVFFYADYANGRIWGLRHEGDKVISNTLLLSTGYAISSFGQEVNGELEVADYKTGKIYRLVRAEAPKTPVKPAVKTVRRPAG
jgi:glucose/arabinose dehydrogenase